MGGIEAMNHDRDELSDLCTFVVLQDRNRRSLRTYTSMPYRRRATGILSSQKYMMWFLSNSALYSE
jgi:hypothetical protein